MAKGLGTALLTTTLFCVMLQGCGGGSGGSQQTAVTITPKPATVAAGSQTIFTAMILNLPKGSADVGWYFVPTSAAGTLTLAENTGSNTVHPQIYCVCRQLECVSWPACRPVHATSVARSPDEDAKVIEALNEVESAPKSPPAPKLAFYILRDRNNDDKEGDCTEVGPSTR
jgi:hypothetical protein